MPHSNHLERNVDLFTLLDALPLGVAAVSPDRRILFINRVLESLSGFSREKAVGLPCANVLRLNFCLTRCPLQKGPRHGKVSRFEGDILTCERQRISVSGAFSSVRDRRGQIAFYLETFEDTRFAGRGGDPAGEAFKVGQIIGRSPEMERVFAILPAIAQADASLLITGETGTGKDIVAEGVHNASKRAKGPFVKVNCGALPEALLESELFGHKRGAFTGAVEDKPGRIQIAHNGTLFLTEIGDLPLSLQVKLLTFLDDRVIYPLGGTKGFAADVRLIAATHLDLEDMVRQGRFRKDLLFRLNVIRVHLPPLRERGGDLRLLTDHFLQHFARRLDKRVKGLSDEAFSVLRAYAFPGNVRELRNIVEYGCTLARGAEIETADLPAYLLDPAPPAPPDSALAPLATAPRQDVRPTLNGPDELERRRILAALAKTRGRKSEAAALLGMGRATLWRKIRRFGIDKEWKLP